MAYIGRSTDGFGVRDRFVYVVSGGATSVSGVDANGAVLKFSDGKYVDVYLNGVLLKPTTDYNTNTANTISNISSMAASDEVTVIVYDIFAVADTVSATQGGTFSGEISVIPDTDATTTLGRALIHSPTSDAATFSHVDKTALNDYAILQSSNGTTYINASSGRAINFNINNSNKCAVTSSGFTGTLTTVAQPNITSVGTLTSFRSTGIDDNANALAMTIDSSERLGIGTTTPSDKLHVKGGQIQIESLAGDGAYLRIDNDANSGGKIWRAGDGISAHGTFSIYNQTDNTFPFNISLDGVTGGSANAGVARYRNHSSLSLGYGSTVQFTVGQGLINVSNRSYGYGALFMVSYASQVAEVSDPSNQFDVGSGGNNLGAGVYKSNNNYTAFVINKDSNLGTRGFSVQVISNDF